MSTFERRAMSAPPTSNPNALTLSGYAALTNVYYEVGFYQEMLVPGCFRRTLGENPDVTFRIQHGEAGSGLPLARTKSGTLSLMEDARGLYFVAELDPEDPDSRMLQRKLARGDLDGQASFAFRANRQKWNDDYTERQVLEAILHNGDVSAVVHGANSQTHVEIAEPAVRSRVPNYTEKARREYQEMLRRYGKAGR